MENVGKDSEIRRMLENAGVTVSDISRKTDIPYSTAIAQFNGKLKLKEPLRAGTIGFLENRIEKYKDIISYMNDLDLDSDLDSDTEE